MSGDTPDCEKWKVPCNGDGEPCPPAILTERAALRARVKELEEHRHILGDQVAALAVTNGKLRRVADAARDFVEDGSTEFRESFILALRELDGEKK